MRYIGAVAVIAGSDAVCGHCLKIGLWGIMVSGGCLCGAVRYEFSGPPDWVGHCHCRNCQRFTGSAFMTFVLFEDATRVTWTADPPEEYQSSPGVYRGFCCKRGSSISFSRPTRNEINVLAGTLDDPGAVKPFLHIFLEQKCPWLELNDGVPGHRRFPPHAVERDTQ